jgi:hypothetical protein
MRRKKMKIVNLLAAGLLVASPAIAQGVDSNVSIDQAKLSSKLLDSAYSAIQDVEAQADKYSEACASSKGSFAAAEKVSTQHIYQSNGHTQVMRVRAIQKVSCSGTDLDLGVLDTILGRNTAKKAPAPVYKPAGR